MKAQKFTKETILNIDVVDRKFPEFKVGDHIEVGQLVKDGDKQRVQLFKGDVIAFHKNGIASTFTVRRIGANNVGVERIFPYFSKMIDSIKLVRLGKVRRAKLNYLKHCVGKRRNIKEKVLTKEQKLQSREKAAARQSS